MLLAIVTGTVLYFKAPWPMTGALVPQTRNEYFLRLTTFRDPWTYAGLKAPYRIMLFTTPDIGYSFLLSALYIFTLNPGAQESHSRCRLIRFWKPATSSASSSERFTTRVSPFLQRNRVGSSSLSVDCLPARSSSVLSVAGRRVAGCIRSPISCWAIGQQIRKRTQAGSCDG